ncbi:TPA: AAA family ATPase [Enterobacter roggenkampii]|uniref:AAA family ATPase n=1 Tax=Enterobacter roggenkampii TaxID=1812935 RepID=UPI0013008100|nr:AAA family ATPase [Enterobacter roggenkampii]HCK7280392.1 AAA family ATPase [Enterobacter roggenkampii]
MELYFSQKMGIEDFDGIHLLQDHIGTNFKTPWNDFGFVILFKVYYVRNNKKEKIGNLRVLVKDIEDTSSYFLENAKKTNDDKIYKITDVMNENVMVSLPTDIDYYKIINNIFLREEADELLRLLCDASYFIGNNDIYKSWNGFSGALFRDNSSGDALLKNGYSIATGSYNINRRITFTADNFIDTIEPITFSFDNEVEFLREDINLLIGKNGVGKTSLLGYIADSILGLNSNDKFPYFNKLLVVAYSPFESFKTELDVIKSRDFKYKSNNNRFSLGRKMQGVNDYTYIGFKNKNGVFDLTWPKEYAANSIVNIINYDNENFWWQDDVKNSRFKLLIETLSLAINFDSFKLWTDSGEEIILNKDSKEKRKVLKKIDAKKGFEIIRQDKPIHLSSGQLMYAYMIPAIVSEMKEESLLILDEPELYLHPTLEMGLIKMLKSLLKDSSSYAIIATHSAVMAREVVKSGVKILREKAGVTKNDIPGIETYGESLDAIVGEVFDDYFQDRPYEIELEKLLKKEDLNDVLDKYSKNLGDEALAYLTSKLSDNSDDNQDDEYIRMEPI